MGVHIRSINHDQSVPAPPSVLRPSRVWPNQTDLSRRERKNKSPKGLNETKMAYLRLCCYSTDSVFTSIKM